MERPSASLPTVIRVWDCRTCSSVDGSGTPSGRNRKPGLSDQHQRTGTGHDRGIGWKEQPISVQIAGRTVQTTDYDLYTFTIPEERQGLPVTYVSDRCGSTSGEGLPARILFQPLDNASWVTDTVDAGPDGRYLICLPAGQRYGMIIEHPGYSFYSQQVDLNDELAFHPYHIDAILFPVLPGDTQDRVAIVLKEYPL